MLMTIGWYPGHMNKARKDIMNGLKRVDIVIEIVDARLPQASENPLLNALIGTIPRLKILNKADLADPMLTQGWLDYYRSQNIPALALDKTAEPDMRELLRQLPSFVQKAEDKITRVMIVGIPNVGKSTLMNKLLGRKIARVGDEPAVTKAAQEISVAENIKLIDTPGVLWPKLEDQQAAYRLAASGAIRNTAIEFEDIALFVIDFLSAEYPQILKSRYELAELADGSNQILEQIAERRGCLRKGGVDYHKASEIILNDLRSGAYGRLSLENPPDF
ncbi:MAG: ribosome biogenesis GTPase YlqF [Gammaproteobacteria bacterium]|nr:ribosome biogenesis GTPase YlqF [Gammaproteobacteria bacterium]MAY01623.1 ribosome biogenesis GTPase YlqF [Gammaproteobacteria bacterium]|tara:strand:+ start:342 stop:1169 length:828 start_codon:yes stop_codon:yes gene_type:complete